MEERLQKIIARSGLTSRRAAEELITAGRVRVNGRIVTELGVKADPRNDRIEVDGTRLVSEQPVYVVLHKPRNVVSTMSDPEGRPTVAEYVKNAGARVYPIGRLDFATSGVLLMTNDGDFSNAMLHPKGGVPKTYIVKVHGVMDDEDADAWRKGVELEDGKTLPAHVHILRHEGDKTWLEVTLREGRNQQIRRMGEATRFPVMRLARTSFAGVTSEGLLPGEWRLLTVDELLEIRKQFGVPKRVRAAATQTDRPRADHRPRRPAPGHARTDEPRPRRQGAAQERHDEKPRGSRVRSDQPRPSRPAGHRPGASAQDERPRAEHRPRRPAPGNARSDEARPTRQAAAPQRAEEKPRVSRVRNDQPRPSSGSAPRPASSRARKDRSSR